MRKGRKELMLIGLTLLAVSAGVVAGLVAARSNAGSVAPVPVTSAGLAQDLQLTPEQTEQMRQIWEGVRDQSRSSFEGAEALQKRRDAEIFSMLTDDQKAGFEKLTRKYADEFATLRRQRDETFKQAVDRTRNLLNDQQRRKYDALLEKHVRPDQFGLAGTTGQGPTTLPSPSSTRSQ